MIIKCYQGINETQFVKSSLFLKKSHVKESCNFFFNIIDLQLLYEWHINHIIHLFNTL